MVSLVYSIWRLEEDIMRQRLPAKLLALLSAILWATGCASSHEPVQQPTTAETSVGGELVPGYKGGCAEGFVLYVQRQFPPLGSMVRRSLHGDPVTAGLGGNEELRAVGWIDNQEVIYPENPPEIQGTVRYYIRQLPYSQGAGWVSSAGVRAVRTDPAPADEGKYFDPATQASPQPESCKLTP